MSTLVQSTDQYTWPCAVQTQYKCTLSRAAIYFVKFALRGGSASANVSRVPNDIHLCEACVPLPPDIYKMWLKQFTLGDCAAATCKKLCKAMPTICYQSELAGTQLCVKYLGHGNPVQNYSNMTTTYL